MVIRLSQQKNNIKNITRAVILCAGEGKRLSEITNNIPKPLIKINSLGNKSILHYTINLLLKLGVNQIAIVKGYLSNKIDKAIISLQDNNQDLKKRLIIIDALKQYKLGPLYSFLSITKNELFFQKKHVYLILPGDTIFQYELLNEVFSIINKNLKLLLKYPLIFYREVSGISLKKKTKSKLISIIEIERIHSQKFLKTIKKKQLHNTPNSNHINQIVPIFLFSYDFIQDIINTEKKIIAKTIIEVVNYLISHQKEILAIKIDSDYNFYDIDTKLDLDEMEKL